MNKNELKKFKKLLIDEKIKLMAELKHISKATLRKSLKDAAGDLSGYSFHMADVASDNYERDMFLNLASSEQETLYKIEEALKMIEQGNYGICEKCNKKIKKSRLKAIPYAILCLKCQEEAEQETS